MRLIDIHSHTHRNSSDVITIYNLKLNELPIENYFSVGVHPWFINEKDFLIQIRQVEELLFRKNAIFIGECGLDKLKCSDFSIQKKVFELQVDLAVKHNKPMILHCVKAFEESLELLKNKISPDKIIFHGFHKSPELAKDLTSKGFFISLGKILFTHPEKAKLILKTIPLSQIFLETDDSEFTIEQVYLKASELSEIPSEILKSEIYKNFNKITSVA